MKVSRQSLNWGCRAGRSSARRFRRRGQPRRWRRRAAAGFPSPNAHRGAGRGLAARRPRPGTLSLGGCPSASTCERMPWDPKDGELCLARTKPEETLVEVRSSSDVQIDCQSWV